MTQSRWIKGTYNGVYTEMREDGPWTYIEHVCDETCAHTIDVGPLFDSFEESEDERAARIAREAAEADARVHITPGQARMLRKLQERQP